MVSSAGRASAIFSRRTPNETHAEMFETVALAADAPLVRAGRHRGCVVSADAIDWGPLLGL
jgi:hypothetical protein